MQKRIRALLVVTVFTGANIAWSQMAIAQDTAANPAITTTKIDVKLKGYVFGIKMLKASYKGEITGDNYNIRADLYTSGLGALLKKFRIWATTKGVITKDRLKPVEHIQQNMNKKNRRVEMKYGEGRVDISIVPRLGSLGKPPATEEQKFNSYDTLSAMMSLMLRGYKFTDQPCEGKIPVFDSKQHYYLRLERDGTKYIKQKGYKGETIRCKVYYEAISGYDPEDLPDAEEAATPVTVYLARYDNAGLYIPVKMKYKISSISAIIKARDIKIIKR